MRTGKYWGSAEHRACITAEKKEVLGLVKKMAEEYQLTGSLIAKMVVDDQYTYYKRLLEYKYD